jgi:hypothetical protein
MIASMPALDVAVEALLDPQTPLGVARQHCIDLHAGLCARLPPLASEPTPLASGVALSPADAARCLLDVLRTIRLLQAVDTAIAAGIDARGPGLQVLYAGCGPLAPLALLLARRWRGHGVRFVLVDVHASSLAAARGLFEWAGVAGMLQATWRADAATLRLPRGLAPAVLIVEVMQRALAREPQLAVLANLLPQCPAEVRLVPQRIRIEAWLARVASEFNPARPRERIALGALLELSRDTAAGFAALLATGATALLPRRLRVPATAPTGLGLMLRTRIETAPGVELADYDSGLTYPHFLLALGTVQPGETLLFDYRLGHDPGFRVRREPATAGSA